MTIPENGEARLRKPRRKAQGFHKVLNNEEGKHKFKFASFSDRIKSIDINPIYRNDFIADISEHAEHNSRDIYKDIFVTRSEDGSPPCELDDNKNPRSEESLNHRIYEELKSTYFQSALLYWKRRVNIPEFKVKCQKLVPLCDSLPSLILHVHEVTDLLFDLIEQDNFVLQEPAYHLLAMLPKDIGDVFCESLPTVLDRLIYNLDERDSDSVDITFFTVTSIFCFLSRFILEELPRYLNHYLPWLTHQVAHVRLFAAESLSYLVRREKAEMLPAAVFSILQLLSGSPVLLSKELKEEEFSAKETCNKESQNSEIKALSDDEDSCSSSDVDENDAEDKPSVENLMAETFGSLMFCIVKNVQNTFNSKLIPVSDCLFKHLKSVGRSTEFLVTSTEMGLMRFGQAMLTIESFVFCLRNHLTEFDSISAKKVESIIFDFLFDSLNNLQSKSFSTTDICSIKLDAVLSKFAFKLVAQWISFRPRPKGDPRPSIKKLMESVFSSLQLVSALHLRGGSDEQESGEKSSNDKECLVFVQIFPSVLETLLSIWKSDFYHLKSLLAEKPEFLILISEALKSLAASQILFSCISQAVLFFDLLLDQVRQQPDQFSPAFLFFIQNSIQYLYLNSCSRIRSNKSDINLETESLPHESGRQRELLDRHHLKTLQLLNKFCEWRSGALDNSDDSWKSINQNILESLKTQVNSRLTTAEHPALSMRLRDCSLIAHVKYLKQILPSMPVTTDIQESRSLHAQLSMLSNSISDFSKCQDIRRNSVSIDENELEADQVSLYTLALSVGCRLDPSTDTKFATVLQLLRFWNFLVFPSTDPIAELSSKRNKTSSSHKRLLYTYLWSKEFCSCLSDMVALGAFTEFKGEALEEQECLSLLSKALLACADNPQHKLRCSTIALIRQLPQTWKRQLFNQRAISNVSSQSAVSLLGLQSECFNLVSHESGIDNDNDNDLLEALLETSETLESLENNIQDEREKTRLIGNAGAFVLRLLELRGITFASIFFSQILLSQLMEKFLPLWSPTMDILLQIIQLANSKPGSTPQRSLFLERKLEPSSHGSQSSGSPAASSQMAEVSQKKRRILDSDEPFSSLHIWLLHSLQNKLLLCVMQLNVDGSSSVPKLQHSQLYLNRKRKGATRFTEFKPLAGSERGDCESSLRNSEVKGMYNGVDDVSFNGVVPCDPLTRHSMYFKIYVGLIKLCASKKSGIFEKNIATMTSSDLAMGHCILWVLNWALVSAKVLSENLEANEEVEDTLEYLQALVRGSRSSRLIDVLRVVEAIGTFGTKFSTQSLCVEGESSSKVEKSSLEMRILIRRTWQELLDFCIHRLFLIPDQKLQEASFKLVLQSQVRTEINEFKKTIEKCINEEDLIGNLLDLASRIKDKSNLAAISILIRVLFSKLSKKSLANDGGRKNMTARRKAIFRFFAMLKTDHLRILFGILIGPLIEVYSGIENTVILEGHKYEFLEIFFKHLSQNYTVIGEDGIEWTIDRGLSNLECATWNFKHHTVKIPFLKTALKPNILAGLLQSLREVITQMRHCIEAFVPFLGQLLISIICQFAPIERMRGEVVNESVTKLSGSYFGSSCDVSVSQKRLRRIVREALSLLGSIMETHTVYISQWSSYLLQTKDLFDDMLKNSLQGGGISGPLNFLCRLGCNANLFSLLNDVFGSSISIAFNVFTCSQTKADIMKGKQNAAVTAVVDFVLRICQGGHEDLAKISKKFRLQKRHETMKTSRKKRTRQGESDYSEEEEEDQGPSISQSIEEQKAAVAEDCERGRAVIQPHIDELLTKFLSMISFRKLRRSAKTFGAQLIEDKASAGSKSKESLNFKELTMIFELVKVPTLKSETARALIDVLTFSLPGSVRRSSKKVDSVLQRLKLTLSAIKELLYHIRVTAEESAADSSKEGLKVIHTVQRLKTAFISLLQSVEDLESRRDLAILLLCTNLLELGVKDPLGVCKLLTRRLPDGKSETNEFMKQIIPTVIQMEDWVPDDTELKALWPVSVSLILVGLSSIRSRITSIEPDFDVHMVVFGELIEKGLVRSSNNQESLADVVNGNDFVIPAEQQSLIILQALFVIGSEGVDTGVRRLALRTVGLSVDRIHRAVQLRHRIQSSKIIDASKALQDTNPITLQKMEDEWLECTVLFRGICSIVMSAIQNLLRSEVEALQQSGLRLVYSIATAFSPSMDYLPSLSKSESFFSVPVETLKSTDPIIGKLFLDLGKLSKCKQAYEIISCSGDIIEDEGGNLFHELLHVQRHRKAKGLLLLTEALEKQLLTTPTINRFCVPLALNAVLQPDSGIRTTFHQGLCERGAGCLAEAVKKLDWNGLMSIIRPLEAAIHRHKGQEALLIKILSRVIMNFKFETPSAKVTTEDHDLDDICEVIQQGRRAVAAQRGKIIEDEEDTQQSMDVENEQEAPASETKLRESRMEITRRFIKFKLLPVLRRLAYTKGGDDSSAVALTAQKGSKSIHRQKQEVLLLRPQILSLHLKVSSHLERDEFHAELPKLMYLLISCLSSKERQARRKARAAVCAIATDLGPCYLKYIIQTMADRLSRGYQEAVLSFTSVAVVLELLFGNQSKAVVKEPIRVECGSIDSSIELLLPMVEVELDRLCDPDRPDYAMGETGLLSRRTRIDEMKYFRSGELILALTRVASQTMIKTVILKFLHGLLSGGSCKGRANASISAVAFNKKFRNLVQTLFEHAAVGISTNASIHLLEKLRLSSQLLRLHVILKSEKGLSTSTMSKDVAEEEDSFFVNFLSSTREDVTMADRKNTQGDGNYPSLNKFIIQPGAATGRSAEQALKVHRGVDQAERATTIAMTGLKLLAAITHELRAEPSLRSLLLTTSKGSWQRDALALKKEQLDSESNQFDLADQEAKRKAKELLVLITKDVIDCFCGDNDDLFQAASRCLLGLLRFHTPCIKTDGQRIAVTILKVFQNTGGSVSKATANHASQISATCTRLLAVLLTTSHSHKWMNRVLNQEDGFLLVKEQTQNKKRAELKQAKTSNINALPLKTALLSHIRYSLDDPRLRLSSLLLFKKLIMTRSHRESFKNAEHATLVNQCADEIGTLLLQHAANEKIAALCCSIYVEFLISFPLEEKALQRRIAFCMKNLDFGSFEGRRAMMAALNEYSKRLDSNTLSTKFAPVVLLALILRLGKEDNSKTRQITCQVIKNILKLITEDSRTSIIRLATKAFLQESVAQREIFGDFLQIVTEVYCGLNILDNKLDLIIDPLSTCLSWTIGCMGFNWIALIQIFTESNERLSLIALKALTQLISSLSGRKLLQILQPSLDVHEDSTKIHKLLHLWRAAIIHGCINQNSHIRNSSLDALIVMLNRSLSARRSQNQKFQIAEGYFSLKMLPEWGVLEMGNSTSQVTPLVKLLVFLTSESRQPFIEEEFLYAESIVKSLPLICSTLIHSALLTEECEILGQEELAQMPEDSLTELPIESSHSFDSVEVEQKEQQDQSMDNLTDCPPLVISSKASTLFISPRAKDISEYEEEDGEEKDDEEDEEEEKEEIKECEVKDEDIDEEELFDLKTSDAYLTLDEIDKPAPSQDIDLVHKDVEGADVPVFESNEEVESLLKRIRVRWLIGRMTWSIKQGLSNTESNFVRVLTALQILSNLAKYLIPLYLKGECSILSTLLHGVYICASLPIMEGINREEEVENITSLTLKNLKSQSPKQQLMFLRSFAEKALGDIQTLMSERDLENEFNTVLQSIRLVINKKRRTRRIGAKIVKVQDPKIAAIRKARKHLRSKNSRKKEAVRRTKKRPS